MNASFLNKYLYHIIAIVAFILVSAAFNMPALQGNKLESHDYFTWVFGAQETIKHYEATGENAHWTNGQFGGMPSVMIDYYANSNWFQKIWHGLMGYKVGQPFNPFYFFLWTMISFYLLSNALRIKPLIGILGAIAFGFSTYHPIIIAAGHNTKMVDLAFLPGVIAGIVWAYRGKYLLGAAVAGLFLAFFLDAGHYQIIFYAVVFSALLAIGYLVEAIKEGKLKTWGIATVLLATVAGLAFLSSSSKIIQTLDYSKYSMRGGQSVLSEEATTGLEKDYAFAWSNGVGEAFCMVVPNLYGASSSYDIGVNSKYAQTMIGMGVGQMDAERMSQSAPSYWGPQSSLSGPMYFGAIIVFLAVLALVVVPSQLKWWIFAGGMVTLFFSFGKNLSSLNYFLFDHVPMFDKFRSPNMAMSITALAFPMLAVWGLHSFMQIEEEKERWKKLKLAGIITGGLMLLILINIAMIYDFAGVGDGGLVAQFSNFFGEQGARNVVNALMDDRQSMAYASWFKSLLFIGLAFATLWAVMKNKLKTVPAIAVLIVLVTIDLFGTGKKYLNENNYIDAFSFSQRFQPDQVDRDILQDPTLYYRVYDLRSSPFNDSRPSIFHKSIGGYHPAKMQAYQDLISAHIGQYNSAVLSMLNTKYIISRGEQNDIHQINPEALGNAWFVDQSIIVNTRKEALDALASNQLGTPRQEGDFNPAYEVVLTKEVADGLNNTSWSNRDEEGMSKNQIALRSYKPNELIFDVNAQEDGFAVFSDIYYPHGWKAKIDGLEIPIHEVNFLLRGLELPAGSYTVSFSYLPPSFEKGERYGYIGSIGLTLLILGGFAQLFLVNFRKKEEKA